MFDFTAIGAKEVTQVLSQRREVLRKELRHLDEALGFYGPADRPVSRDTGQTTHRKASPLSGPTEAVLAAVDANPGQPLRVIVNGALAKGVKSNAKDQKHLLRNTVDVLLRKGVLVRLDGKLYRATTSVVPPKAD